MKKEKIAQRKKKKHTEQQNIQSQETQQTNPNAHEMNKK